VKPTFWVTNFSNRNVSLTDLALTIRARSSVNLLDEDHYQYTQEQLEKSAKDGSIFKKRRMVRKRKVPPSVESTNILIDREAIVPSRQRSVLDLKEEKYEELSITDEQFVEEIVEPEPKPQKG